MAFFMLMPLLDATKYLSLSFLNIDFTFGAIIKFIFMLFALYYLIFINKNKKYVLLYLGLLLVYGLILLIPYPNTNLLYWELKAFLKIYFFIIMLIFFYLNKEKIKAVDKCAFDYLLFIYLLLIVLLYFLRGYLSYNLDAKELGIIIALLFPIYASKMFNAKDKLNYLPLIVLYICTMFIAGTKTPLFSFVVTMLVLGIKYLIDLIKKKEIKKLIALMIIKIMLILFIIIIIPETPFYNNLKNQMNYFNINSYKEIFSSYKNINNIIFSKRLTLAEDSINNFNKDSNYKKLVGNGYYEIKDNEVVKKASSGVDYIDILVSYGIIGSLLFFIPVIYIFINNIINLKSKKTLYLLLSFLVFIFAFISGGIFMLPIISLYVALFLNWY